MLVPTCDAYLAVVQGDWKSVTKEEADDLLALVHSVSLPLEGVCLHGSENDKPLPSRKALAVLRASSIDAESLAGTDYNLHSQPLMSLPTSCTTRPSRNGCNQANRDQRHTLALDSRLPKKKPSLNLVFCMPLVMSL